MSSALTNVAIQSSYVDVLQMGNTGSGLTSSPQTVVDGAATASALQLATTSVATTNWLRQSSGVARVTTPVTRALATFTSITDLSLTLIAGRKYIGQLVLFAKNSVAAEGLQFDLNGGGATMTSIIYGFSATPPGASLALGVLTSTALATALTVTTATTADAVYVIPVALVCNVAGTIIPRLAEATSTSGTATVETNSYFYLVDSPN